MTTYDITSKSGATMGTYEGETPAEALAAMHRDAGYTVTVEDGDVAFRSDDDRAVCGGVDEWTIRPVVWHVEESDGRGGWQLTARGECSTEAEAEESADALTEELGYETRVRRVVG